MHNRPPEHTLDRLLESHLGPVSAPDHLWDLVQHPPARQSSPHLRTSVLLLAAALLAAAAWIFLLNRTNQPLSRQDLAIQALAHEPEDLELRTDTVTEIRTWVKSKTGLDIPLPAATSQAVQMTGVCAVKGGAPAVEVSYRVGGHNAALVVSKAGLMSSVGPKHRFLKCESIGSTRVSSWTMRGQLYTLAYASPGEVALGGSQDECLLCHSAARQLTLSN